MQDLQQLRLRLLELHKALVDAERAVYEANHGRVSANAFWQALTSDPSLAWLGPLSAAIVRFDELLDLSHASDTSETKGALAEQLAALASLLDLDGTDAFAARYRQLVHDDPNVTFAHAALSSALA